MAVMTDGFFEYENRAGEQFGEQRIQDLLRAHHADPMADAAQRIVEAVSEFADGAPQADDMTILLVRRTS